MIKFTYIKPDGAVSSRSLFVLKEPSDSYFGIDLSEFNEEERTQYDVILGDLTKQLEEAIAELGLNNCYRRFKKERMNELER